MKTSNIKFSLLMKDRLVLKPNFHLNSGRLKINEFIEKGGKCAFLKDTVKDIYTGGIFKRIFIEEKEKGLPYITAQYMMHANPLEVAKNISKKFTPRQDDMTLWKGQILVSCAGTVGNIRLITKDLNGTIGSQDIIRVISDDTKLPIGYIYAYLSSNIAFNYIQSFVYGSVVPRIDPIGLGKLPVPILSKEIQTNIGNLIDKTANLREESNRKLQEAIKLISNKLPKLTFEKNYISKVNDLKPNRLRFDATSHTMDVQKFYETLKNNAIPLFKISELSSNVFTPNIFKRVRVDDPKRGVPFLGGANLLEARPRFKNYLSKNMKNIDDYKLKEGWLTIQDSGSLNSIGYISLVPGYLDGVTATNNLVKIEPLKEKNYNPFLYAFLKTKQAQKIIKSYAYGTGQLHIDNNQMQNFLVPFFDDIFEEVTKKVEAYLFMKNKAYLYESKAIQTIENEIASWQKSNTQQEA